MESSTGPIIGGNRTHSSLPPATVPPKPSTSKADRASGSIKSGVSTHITSVKHPPKSSSELTSDVNAAQWVRGNIPIRPKVVVLAAKFLTKETGQQWNVTEEGNLETKFPHGNANKIKEKIREVISDLKIAGNIRFRQNTEAGQIIHTVSLDKEDAMELGRLINPVTKEIRKT